MVRAVRNKLKSTPQRSTPDEVPEPHVHLAVIVHGDARPGSLERWVLRGGTATALPQLVLGRLGVRLREDLWRVESRPGVGPGVEVWVCVRV